MDGETFYKFLASEKAGGRRFVRISDNGDDECDVIYMEASDKEFRNWKANDNRRLYYKKLHSRRRKKVYMSELVKEDDREGLTFEDVIGSDDELPEEAAVRRMLAEELHAAMERLPAEERELLEMYYWESMKLQEIGRPSGRSRPPVSSLQPANAESPMLVRPSGRWSSPFNPLQPLNAQSPMLVRLSGR